MRNRREISCRVRKIGMTRESTSEGDEGRKDFAETVGVVWKCEDVTVVSH